MTKLSLSARSIGWLLLAAGLLLVAFYLRVDHLLDKPAFIDEALHIGWAHRIAGGELLAGIEHDKWLYAPVLALFNPTGPEGLWLARLISVWCGILAMAGCIALGRELHSEQAGGLAGLLYVLVPVGIEVERQAFVDPMQAAFTSLSLALMPALARRPRPGVALALGTALFATLLSKGSGLPVVAMPLIAVIMLAAGPAGRDSCRLAAAAWAVGAAAAALGAKALTFSAARLIRPVEILEHHRAATALRDLLPGLVASDALRSIGEQMGVLWQYLWQDIGIVPVGLIGLGLVWAALGIRRRELLFLAIPGLGIGMAYALLFALIEDPPTDSDRLPLRSWLWPPLPCRSVLTG